jgi:DNA-binding CsgD family transcriptional regulator
MSQPIPMRLADRLLRDDPLTPAQVRVLELMADGHSRASAARKFGRQEETVKYQLRLIRYKLHARNTTHAVAIALREGLIS